MWETAQNLLEWSENINHVRDPVPNDIKLRSGRLLVTVEV